MAGVIACLAMIVAFAALWIAAEGMRRASSQTEDFLKAHVQGIRMTMTEYAKTLQAMDGRLQVLEKQAQAFKQGQAKARETLLALERRTRETKAAPPEGEQRDVA